MARFSIILPSLGFFGRSLGNSFVPTNGNALSPLHGTPYFEEVHPESTFTVDNSTLTPVISPDGSGIAIQTSTTQFHTHVNFRFPSYINEGSFLCQLAFRIDPHPQSAVDDGANSAELDLFELDSPTNATHHPDIAGYRGRWVAKELVQESGVAYTEYGIQPFDCSSMRLGGLLMGFEVSPKWWDPDARVNISWSGFSEISSGCQFCETSSAIDNGSMVY
ncbi:hypothetical protein INS49_004803 [Diaporthe citri]|uniref:uncharacterized protein n=1 Tax=Diaporthe citri TaxID=83186 RepID=UPI001C819033|nr:uncharacterized protein INS49_004803 [Diaporthe citri]KAG6354199.1 hypothetical protein INS49_004803 [Diaporthe citri]